MTVATSHNRENLVGVPVPAGWRLHTTGYGRNKTWTKQHGNHMLNVHRNLVWVDNNGRRDLVQDRWDVLVYIPKLNNNIEFGTAYQNPADAAAAADALPLPPDKAPNGGWKKFYGGTYVD